MVCTPTMGDPWPSLFPAFPQGRPREAHVVGVGFIHTIDAGVRMTTFYVGVNMTNIYLGVIIIIIIRRSGINPIPPTVIDRD